MENYMDNCIFCKIGNKEISAQVVWEDQTFMAFMDLRPVNPGHLLIIPKQHAEYIFDLEEPLYTEIFHVAKRLSVPLQKAFESKRVGVVVEGFGVDHVHVHLVPINAAGQLDSTRAHEVSQEELVEAAEKIKKYV